MHHLEWISALFALHRLSLKPAHFVLYYFLWSLSLQNSFQMNTIDTCCFPNWVGSMLTNWEALIWLGTKDAVRVPDPSHYWHTNLHGTGIISMLFRNECSVTSNCWKCVINEVFVRKEELPINLLDEGRFKMRNFQVCLASYLSIVQQGDAGSVFRGFRTSFYPFYLSTCLQLLFLLLTVDTWRWHPIFAELFKVLRVAPLVPSFREV